MSAPRRPYLFDHYLESAHMVSDEQLIRDMALQPPYKFRDYHGAQSRMVRDCRPWSDFLSLPYISRDVMCHPEGKVNEAFLAALEAKRRRDAALPEEPEVPPPPPPPISVSGHPTSGIDVDSGDTWNPTISGGTGSYTWTPNSGSGFRMTKSGSTYTIHAPVEADIYISNGIFTANSTGMGDYSKPAGGTDWDYSYRETLQINSPDVIPWYYRYWQTLGNYFDINDMLIAGYYLAGIFTVAYSAIVDGDDSTSAQNTTGANEDIHVKVPGYISNIPDFAPHIMARKIQVKYEGTINSINLRRVNSVNASLEVDGSYDYQISGSRSSGSATTWSYDTGIDDPYSTPCDYCLHDVKINWANNAKIYFVKIS